MRRLMAALLATVACGAAVWLYTNRGAPTPLVAPPNGGTAPKQPPVDDIEIAPERRASADDVREALDRALRVDAGRSLPAGLTVLGAEVEGPTATVDLSKELLAVNGHGDTVESAAQKAIRGALSGLAGLRYVTVRVEGRPFEGDHSGPWTDVPIADVRAGGGP